MDDFSFIVAPDESGKRLDTLVADHISQCSRSYAAELIREGMIYVDDVRKKPAYKVRVAEIVKGRIPDPTPMNLTPEPIALDIIFEDESLLVLNKPAGLVVHPAAGHGSGTLVHGLLHHWPALKGIGGVQRPGIVHRLDKDTSGLLLVAKDSRVHEELSRQFKERRVVKTYLALVYGVPHAPKGRIELPIGRHLTDRKKMSTRSAVGRTAVTNWKLKESYRGFALLEVYLETGRTHQIRVHCQSIGHAVVGDPVYTPGRAIQREYRQSRALHLIAAQAQRQMLHAWRLAFTHPGNGSNLSFEAPVPPDMSSLLDELRAEARNEA